MDYITTTDLRTQTSKLVRTLKSRGKVSLIHRSEVIGVIQPVEPVAKTFDAVAFSEAVKALKMPPTTYEEREKRYRAHLEEKYGKNLSRR